MRLTLARIEKSLIKKMNAKKIKFAVLVVFIITAIIVVRRLGGAELLDSDALRAWIEGFGPWGPAIFMLIYCIAPSLMLPGLPITVAGGILFGPFWGSVYVIFGATTGASIAFLISRYLGRGLVEGMARGRARELDEGVRRSGWKIVAFTRLIPLFPFNILNYAFGLTSVKFSHYVIASFIFMLPGAVAYVVFSSSLLDLAKGRISKEFLAGIVLVVIISLIPIIYRKYKHSHPSATS